MSQFFSVSEEFFCQYKPVYCPVEKGPIILCDFDGTISLRDVTDILLTRFAKDGYEELEEQWRAGTIGSQECMRRQIALMDANLAELDEVLAQVEIDPNFKSFFEVSVRHGIAVHIVSDGLDYAIQSILKNNGFSEDIPVFANRLLHDHKRRWRLDFPYANGVCRKASGNCKCAHLINQCQFFSPIFYVGDGFSDYCVSYEVDLVLAKSKLADYCTEHAIAHYAIRDFSDVITMLPIILPAQMQRDFLTEYVV